MKRVTEARDILKKAAAYQARSIRVKYAFMRDHPQSFRIRSMCRGAQRIIHQAVEGVLKVCLDEHAADRDRTGAEIDISGKPCAKHDLTSTVLARQCCARTESVAPWLKGFRRLWIGALIQTSASRSSEVDHMGKASSDDSDA